MKKRLPPFAAGMLTAALIGGLGLSALAASGQMTITVDPINIQVNGQTFQPKDATGADVPVFAYNGTTYAPLRALAEAYGLEVGYDAQANMATVGAKVAEEIPAPDGTDYTFDFSYEEFLGLWDVESSGSSVSLYGKDAMKTSAWWDAVNPELRDTFLLKASSEKFRELNINPNSRCRFRYRTTDKIIQLAYVQWGEIYLDS